MEHRLEMIQIGLAISSGIIIAFLMLISIILMSINDKLKGKQ